MPRRAFPPNPMLALLPAIVPSLRQNFKPPSLPRWASVIGTSLFLVSLLMASGCESETASDVSNGDNLSNGNGGQTERAPASPEPTPPSGKVMAKSPAGASTGSPATPSPDPVGSPAAKRETTISPENSEEFRRAVAAMHEGRLDDGERRFAELVKRYPDNTGVLRYAAQTSNYRGNRSAGNRFLRMAAQVGPLKLAELRALATPSDSYLEFGPSLTAESLKSSPTFLNEIRALQSRGELPAALAALESSELVRSRDAAAMTLLGRYLLDAQRFDQLNAWFQSADVGWDEYADHWVAVGGLAAHDRQWDRAVDAFARAVALEPFDAKAVIRLSAALDAAGNETLADVYRERFDVLKNLRELIDDVARRDELPPQIYQIITRELSGIGLPLTALGWSEFAERRFSSQPLPPAQVHQRRQTAVALQNSTKALEQRLPGLAARLNRDIVSGLKKNLKQKPKPPPSTSGGGTESQPDVHFTNIAATAGLDFQYLNASPVVSKYFLLHQSLGAGVACLDFDADGRIDLYFAQGAGNPPASRGTRPNLLARNQGKKFVDCTTHSGSDDRGYSMGVTSGDWNQDGFADLIVGNMGVNRLLINQGDGTFRELSLEDPLWQTGKYTTGLAIADVNGDRVPDLVEANYTDSPEIFSPIRFAPDGSPVRLPGPLQFAPAANRLFISDGSGRVRGEAFPQESDRAQYSLGLLVGDIDSAPGNEIFIANDQTPNQFWKQTTEGLSEIAVLKGVAYGGQGTPTACMGIAQADFDMNGRLDLHVTNFNDEWPNHYLQDGSGFFTDLAIPSGFQQDSYETMGFGTQAIDFFNDGSPGLVVGNGHLEDFRERGTAFQMPTHLFVSDGKALRRVSPRGDANYWEQPHLTRALAKLDWNNDGRLDFVATDLLAEAALMENRTDSQNHFLQVELAGTSSERDAVGSIVTVTLSDGTTRRAWSTSGDGYMCKNEPVLQFGIGDEPAISKLSIRWPDGKEQHWEDIAADQRILAIQGQVDLHRR